MPNNWEYLGDGVYAHHDGFGVLLHVNSHNEPTDRVYLEPSVFDALTNFKERKVREWRERQKEVTNATE